MIGDRKLPAIFQNEKFVVITRIAMGIGPDEQIQVSFDIGEQPHTFLRMLK